MLRFLYLAGLGYLGICLAALAFRPAAPLSHPGGRLAVAPGRGDAGAWFAAIKPFCNSVEVETAQQRNPAPSGADGQGYSAACYALAGRIDQARTVIGRLMARDRSYAAGIVFGVGHPVADAGDDKSAGPIMELVIEFQPENYMALYHAGMSEYVLGQPGPAIEHLRRFLELYRSNDGWRTNAIEVLQRLSGGP
ncbi:MAG TPA: tetratricopeptide repeat protein [Candidatus Acidoferrum sp.]|nr:tetratricopeptide repeat protein [Candidatus Acidoferrum sp.]